MKHATQQQTTAPQQEKAHGTKHKSPQEILEFQSKMRIDQSTHQEALTAGAFFFFFFYRGGGGGMEREKENIIIIIIKPPGYFYLFIF